MWKQSCAVLMCDVRCTMCIHCECRTIHFNSRFSSNWNERMKCRVKIALNGIATQKCLFNSIPFYFILKLKFALPLLRWVCAFSAFRQHKSTPTMTTWISNSHFICIETLVTFLYWEWYKKKLALWIETKKVNERCSSSKLTASGVQFRGRKKTKEWAQNS